MVMSTHHTEALWSNIQSSEWPVANATILNEKESLNFLEKISGSIKTATFRGRLVIEGPLPMVLERNFYVSVKDNLIRIEDFPEPPSPKFLIELITRAEPDRVRVVVNASGPSVEAAVLSTRIACYQVESSTKFSLQNLEDDSLLPFQLHALSEEVAKEVISSAKLFRKLKYIEECFNVEFSLPNNITASDAKLVEIIFRGITEGEFTTRGFQFPFKETVVKKADLDNPPFSSEGGIKGSFNLPFILFDKKLDAGQLTYYLEHALLADPTVIDKINKNPAQPIDIRFEVLDNQIYHRFERYAKQSKKQRKRRLEHFKNKLAREEPQWIVDLIDESLQNDVSADEAVQIAAGWQQYNDLPDRFCPQEPEFDENLSAWRVPIRLVYIGKATDPVGELLIDLKTGKIISQPAIEELYRKGTLLAEEMLHVS